MAKPGTFLLGFLISGLVTFELMAQLAFRDSNYQDWNDAGAMVLYTCASTNNNS